MTIPEFSNAFDVLYNSYSSQAPFGVQSSRELDEFEKSVFLTKAQEEVVINLYNGKNLYNDSFESTEEIRRYLDGLVKTKVYTVDERTEGPKVSENSIFYKLPPDLLFITMEQVSLEDDRLGCYKGTYVSVYPVTQDEYGKIKNNPFRGPTKYKAIRLDSGESTVELISKYEIGSYLIRYLSKPKPIILEDLGEGLSIDNEHNRSEKCELSPLLHDTILQRAVRLALSSKGIGVEK